MKMLFVGNAFKRDMKFAAKRGRSIKKMLSLLDCLVRDGDLPARCRPHRLSGVYAGLWAISNPTSF